MKRIHLGVYSCLISITAICQPKTWISAEGSFTRDEMKFHDPGQKMYNVKFWLGMGGGVIRQQLLKHGFVEAGLLYKVYGQSFQFTDFYMGSNSEIGTLVIPVRAGVRLNALRKKIFLNPVIGYSRCINLDFDQTGYRHTGPRFFSVLDIIYDVEESADSPKHFGLYQLGVELEVVLFRRLSVCLTSSKYFSDRSLLVSNVIYSVKGTTSQSTSILTGDFFSFGTSIKYPISDFWQQKRSD